MHGKFTFYFNANESNKYQLQIWFIKNLTHLQKVNSSPKPIFWFFTVILFTYKKFFINCIYVVKTISLLIKPYATRHIISWIESKAEYGMLLIDKDKTKKKIQKESHAVWNKDKYPEDLISVPGRYWEVIKLDFRLLLATNSESYYY